MDGRLPERKVHWQRKLQACHDDDDENARRLRAVTSRLDAEGIHGRAHAALSKPAGSPAGCVLEMR